MYEVAWQASSVLNVGSRHEHQLAAGQHVAALAADVSSQPDVAMSYGSNRTADDQLWSSNSGQHAEGTTSAACPAAVQWSLAARATHRRGGACGILDSPGTATQGLELLQRLLAPTEGGAGGSGSSRLRSAFLTTRGAAPAAGGVLPPPHSLSSQVRRAFWHLPWWFSTLSAIPPRGTHDKAQYQPRLPSQCLWSVQPELCALLLKYSTSKAVLCTAKHKVLGPTLERFRMHVHCRRLDGAWRAWRPWSIPTAPGAALTFRHIHQAPLHSCRSCSTCLCHRFSGSSFLRGK